MSDTDAALAQARDAPPFVVFALPRCRTAWTSRYLAYGGWQVGHDELRHCRSLDDVHSWLAQPYTGTVETAAGPFWRLLPEGVTAAVVRRPLDEVLDSLWRGKLQFEPWRMAKHLAAADAKLRQFAHRRPGVLCTTFAELATEEGCARLFEHCLPFRHDPAWWRALDPVNMQVSIPHMQRYYYAHAPQLERLRLLARHEMLRRFRRPIEMDGVTFQQETLAALMADAARPAGDECVAFGVPAEAWRSAINLPLWQRLEDGGGLHIMTARSNGKMFGYLVSALGEAFHAEGQIEAEQVGFFADPSWPGLGRKLQHASIEDLRAKGADRVMMLNLDGSRVGSLYRRLGAKQTGQRFVLELQA